MNLKEYKQKALSNKTFKDEYEKYDLSFEIGQMIIEARILKGLTQAKLAQLVKTKQPGIARLENGKSLPSLSFLEKIAKAFGTYLLAPRFAFFDSKPHTSSNSTPMVFTVKTWSKTPICRASGIAVSTSFNNFLTA